jgi:hypothetical protein
MWHSYSCWSRHIRGLLLRSAPTRPLPPAPGRSSVRVVCGEPRPASGNQRDALACKCLALFTACEMGLALNMASRAAAEGERRRVGAERGGNPRMRRTPGSRKGAGGNRAKGAPELGPGVAGLGLGYPGPSPPHTGSGGVDSSGGSSDSCPPGLCGRNSGDSPLESPSRPRREGLQKHSQTGSGNSRTKS